MTTNLDGQSAEAVPSITAATQLFRAMAQAANGNPRIADNHLGVRVGTDIEVDTDFNVKPDTGGMSVTPKDPMDLPQHRRPIELGGTSRWPIWWIHDGKLPTTLKYRPDPQKRTHGFVEPSTLMSITDYRAAVVGTAAMWTLYA